MLATFSDLETLADHLHDLLNNGIQLSRNKIKNINKTVFHGFKHFSACIE